jgi:lipid-A-disaccharide synthase
VTGPTIFLLAGEASGDLLGARLMAALKRKTGGAVRFVGVGGPEMAREGLASLFPFTDLANFGLVEVLPRVPLLLRRMREVAAAARAARPDAIVTIDVPSFASGVWRRLQDAGIPLIHYVAPTVWAWRPGRAQKLARYLDHLMVLLPFEPPYFERVGLGCSFVGHPVVETGFDADRAAGQAFRARHGIRDDVPVLLLLPGSRRGEVRRHLAPFGQALAKLHAKYPTMVAVVPTVSGVADAVAAAAAAWPARSIVVRDISQKAGAFAASDVALAASGTVVLELALAQVPQVAAYRLSGASWAVAKRMVRVKYVTLVNLLLDRPAVPELLQENCRGDLLAAEVARLLDDVAARDDQLEAGRAALAKLSIGDLPPSERAADVVLEIAAKGKRR